MEHVLEELKAELIQLASAARLHAYCPYSKFSVGAAILTRSGRIFTGANVENASYGLTICAERSAAIKAVNENEREFLAVACVGGKVIEHSNSIEEEEYCAPCGACRQFLFEFNFEHSCIVLGLENGCTGPKIVEDSLDFLLPKAFGPKNLK